MRERAHMFGSHRGLVGVVCEPDGGADAGKPVAVFSNVGLNHRVGPNRFWVELARGLAGEGYASLRFDLSGLGDSEPRSDSRSDSERAVLDLSEALDFLEATLGARGFVLMANCSGVDSLHAVASRDPRVVGAVYIDGYAWRNRRYLWRRRLLGPLQPGRWRSHFAIRRFTREARSVTGEAVEVWKRDLPSRERFAQDLEALLARRVRLLFVYTGGADFHYNYRGQFHDLFGHRDEVEVDYHPRADHLLSRGEDRRRVLDRIRRWMTSTVTAGAQPTRSADPEPAPSSIEDEGADAHGRKAQPERAPARLYAGPSAAIPRRAWQGGGRRDA